MTLVEAIARLNVTLAMLGVGMGWGFVALVMALNAIARAIRERKP